VTAAPCENSTAAAADQRCSGLGSRIPSQSSCMNYSDKMGQHNAHDHHVSAIWHTRASDASSEESSAVDSRPRRMPLILFMRLTSKGLSDPHRNITLPHTKHTLLHHDDTHSRHSDAAVCCFSLTPMQAPSRPRHQSSSLIHASPHTSRHTNHTVPITSHHHSQHHTLTRNTRHHHRDTHSGHPDAAACCSSPTPMQAPSRPRHECRCLMHASPHTSRHTNHTVLSRAITSHHRHPQHHTPHTTHTPASLRHSLLTSRCCSVLFLSNADASAVAPSAPMSLPDVRRHAHHETRTALSRTITSHHHLRQHTPHTKHTPASHRHSRQTSRC
jgi:hypothetical protein